MRELIQKIKNALPIIVGIASLDGYRRTVINDLSRSRLEQATNKLEHTTARLKDLHSQLLMKKQDIDMLEVKESGIPPYGRGRIDELLKKFQNSSEELRNRIQNCDENFEESNKVIIETIQPEANKIVARLSF